VISFWREPDRERSWEWNQASPSWMGLLCSQSLQFVMNRRAEHSPFGNYCGIESMVKPGKDDI
jgi:hypothetical protein